MVEHVPQKLFEEVLHSWAEEEPSDAAFVTLEIPENAEYFLRVDVSAGFGVTDEGELVALFNGSEKSGVGSELVEEAKQRGAQHLSCFETLVGFYEPLGFSVTGRTEWDEEYAPENWDYETYGRPDVVTMELE